MAMNSINMRIKQVAEQLGISLATLRRWEAQGVIPEVPRTTLGWRLYSPDEIARLRAVCETRCASKRTKSQSK